MRTPYEVTAAFASMCGMAFVPLTGLRSTASIRQMLPSNIYTRPHVMSRQASQPVCEYWLARIPHLGGKCDLTTVHGRDVDDCGVS